MSKETGSGSQWSRFEELAAKTGPPGVGDANADRFHSAGAYANWITADDADDETWAQAFWDAWHNN